MLTHLDLFSGIGGFALGFRNAGGIRTVAFCEIEPYAQKVLAKNFPDTPIYPDVKEIKGDELISRFGTIDIITAGFPCQDISCAGKQAGIKANRSGLFYEAARIIGEVRPRFAILENVTALLSGDNGDWFGQILAELATIGYDAEWHCIQAADFGAPHIRDRVWILAYPSIGGRSGETGVKLADDDTRLEEDGLLADSNDCRADVAYAESVGGNGGERRQSSTSPISEATRAVYSAFSKRKYKWEPEPDVGRSLDGFSSWLDRCELTDSHKCIMAYVDNTYGEILNAKTKKRRTIEVLRALRNQIGASDIQWEIGGFGGVQTQEILLSYLCKLKKDYANEAWIQLESTKTPDKSLRSLRTQQEPAGASYRPGQNEQQSGEYTDSLQTLSRFLAHHAKEAWFRYCRENASTFSNPWGVNWEYGIRRVADGIPRRVDRLRGLGNAVVPQIPEFFGRLILEVQKKKDKK